MRGHRCLTMSLSQSTSSPPLITGRRGKGGEGGKHDQVLSSSPVLTATVIFPIICSGTRPTLSTTSKLPPSYFVWKMRYTSPWTPHQCASVYVLCVCVQVCLCVSNVILYHVLHADGDLIVQPEVAEEAYDVRRVALVQDLQLAHDLVPHSCLDV